MSQYPQDQYPQEQPPSGYYPRPSQQQPYRPQGYPQQPYGAAPQGYYPPSKSVTKVRKSTSHTFHLILTIFTGGMWGLFVWWPLTMWHKIGPKKKVVTRYR